MDSVRIDDKSVEVAEDCPLFTAKEVEGEVISIKNKKEEPEHDGILLGVYKLEKLMRSRLADATCPAGTYI